MEGNGLENSVGDNFFTDECKHLQNVGTMLFFAATVDGVDLYSEYNKNS